MQVIDFHTHPFQDETQNMCFYQNTGKTWRDILLLKDNGVRYICGSVLSREPSVTVWELNNAALRLRDLLGDFYVPGFHIHPGDVKRSVCEIRRMAGEGVRLIGELVPYIHGWGNFQWTDYLPELDEIFTAAAECGMTVSCHVSLGPATEKLLDRHPKLNVVEAHPGERDGAEAHIRRMKAHPNLYLDLSGTGIARLGCIRHLTDAVGADRLLFGSDYPICNQAMYIRAVQTEDVSPEDREKILFGNAARLLGLNM